MQLILDISNNWHYTPFEMGVACETFVPPFKATREEGVIGHKLLSIHFWPEEFGPVGSTPGSGGTGGKVMQTYGGQTGYTEVWGSYFYYRSGRSGFPSGNGPAIYNEFQSPIADGELLTESLSQFDNRKHIIHRPRFANQNPPWATMVVDGGAVTWGSSPLPYGTGYVNAIPQGAVLGRSYTYDFLRNNTVSRSDDICDAIFEDMQAFFA